ncbi:hypothetical protein HYS82_00630, partial [Candidatus Amesbacteria bacterium]|nr:hypothetical protein [Candidatus Amesbacteria bacterium]
TLFSDWFAQASYDGIAFDNSNPINPDSARFSNVVAAIGQDHVARWNKGMTQLHKQLHKKYPGKIVLFNGVAPKKWKPNRSLELFSEADMALHENFCWDRKGPKSEESILDDVKLIQTYAAKGKTLLYKTNHPLEWNGNDYRDEIDITGKYCLGAFLLGYEPGYAYYKFGYGYGVSLKSPGDEIRENAPRIEYAWGNPEGKYSTYQGVYRRKFQNAWVVVNLSNSDKVITMWRRLQTLNGERTLEKDSKNTIHARTAEFFR